MRLRSEIGRPVAGVSLFCAFVMACGTTVLGASLPEAAEPADSAEAAARPSVRLLDLSSLRRQFNVLARQRPSMPEGARVGAWADFTTMAAAVIGEARIAPLTFDDLAATAASADGPRVAVTSGLGIRDEAAYQTARAWLFGARNGRRGQRPYQRSGARQRQADDCGRPGP